LTRITVKDVFIAPLSNALAISQFARFFKVYGDSGRWLSFAGGRGSGDCQQKTRAGGVWFSGFPPANYRHMRDRHLFAASCFDPAALRPYIDDTA
jgi:hypothetical protein